MLEVTRLAAHADRRVEVKWQLVLVQLAPLCTCAPRLSLDETVKARNVFQFRVRIEEERRVVRIGDAKGVQLLQICNKVVDALCVQELRSQ